MLRLSADKEAWFPNLTSSNYQITSDPTDTYNCIAHAAEDSTNWWWPADSPCHWPLPEKFETLDCFVAAYATLGYRPAASLASDAQIIERVAIYADQDGIPTHAARQLNNGKWTSKLGEWEDIEHDTIAAVEDLNDLGLGYGACAIILERMRPIPPPSAAPR
jgi:hypothetical protein